MPSSRDESGVEVMKIAMLGVVGSGTMGAGIAQRCAMYDYPVILVDNQPGQLESARAGMERSLGKFVEKGRLTPESKRAALDLSLIHI